MASWWGRQSRYNDKFVNWTSETPYGGGSWAMIDLLHVRSALAKVTDLGSLTPQSLARCCCGIVERGVLRVAPSQLMMCFGLS
jgi:hypothetical protein